MYARTFKGMMVNLTGAEHANILHICINIIRPPTTYECLDYDMAVEAGGNLISNSAINILIHVQIRVSLDATVRLFLRGMDVTGSKYGNSRCIQDKTAYINHLGCPLIDLINVINFMSVILMVA